MKIFGVVYLIVNMVNGKKYVGQTTRSVELRFKEHFREETYIGRAMRKHGIGNFLYEVIEECESRVKLNEREIFWIDYFNSKSPNGYNCTDGGEGTLGTSVSEEVRAKRSLAMRGNQFALGIKRSPETRAKIAAAKMGDKNPNYGKPLSDEQKAKLSASLTGKKKNLDFNGEKNPFFGKTHALSTRMLISAARRGHTPYKNLLAEMDARKLTHESLAKILEMSRSLVSRKIRGERNFTDKDKVKLEEIFGLPAEYLLQRDEG